MAYSQTSNNGLSFRDKWARLVQTGCKLASIRLVDVKIAIAGGNVCSLYECLGYILESIRRQWGSYGKT